MESRVPTSGLGPVPAEQPMSPASETGPSTSTLKYSLGKVEAPSLNQNRDPRSTCRICGDVQADASTYCCVQSCDSLSFPIQPAHSHVTNHTITAKKISPVHIKIVDWNKWTCSTHLAWTPTMAPFAHCARGPFRHLVGFSTLVFLGHSAPVRVIIVPALLPAPGAAHSSYLQTENHSGLQHDVSDWEWSRCHC